MLLLEHSPQQIGQFVPVLNRSQIGRVWTGDVDHKVSYSVQRVEPFQACNVINSRVFLVSVFAQIHTDNNVLRFDGIGLFLQVCHHRIVAVRIEAVSIDDGSVWLKAEHTRIHVSALRDGSGGANLDKTKTKVVQTVDCLAVLVEASGKTNRVVEVDAQEVCFLDKK